MAHWSVRTWFSLSHSKTKTAYIFQVTDKEKSHFAEGKQASGYAFQSNTKCYM